MRQRRASGALPGQAGRASRSSRDSRTSGASRWSRAVPSEPNRPEPSGKDGSAQRASSLAWGGKVRRLQERPSEETARGGCGRSVAEEAAIRGCRRLLSEEAAGGGCQRRLPEEAAGRGWKRECRRRQPEAAARDCRWEGTARGGCRRRLPEAAGEGCRKRQPEVAARGCCRRWLTEAAAGGGCRRTREAAGRGCQRRLTKEAAGGKRQLEGGGYWRRLMGAAAPSCRRRCQRQLLESAAGGICRTVTDSASCPATTPPPLEHVNRDRYRVNCSNCSFLEQFTNCGVPPLTIHVNSAPELLAVKPLGNAGFCPKGAPDHRDGGECFAPLIFRQIPLRS